MHYWEVRYPLSVRHGILGLLAKQPRHGYELKTGFDTLTGGLWELNVGQVYTTLDRMRKDGLEQLLKQAL
jgi:DNA-binding PadR family transcriptional regulator